MSDVSDEIPVADSERAEPLTTEILEAWKAQLVRVGAPAVGHLMPGLRDEEIDRIARTENLGVPPELRTFWRWADGPPSDTLLLNCSISPNWSLASCFDAYSSAGETRDWYQNEPDSTEEDWNPTWVTFMYAQSEKLVVDGATSGACSPVHYFDVWSDTQFDVFPSLGALFRFWTRMISEGYYVLGDSGFWDEREDTPFSWIT